MKAYPYFLTSKEVEFLLRISKRTLQNYRDDGRIHFIRISKKTILYRIKDVEELLMKSSCSSYRKDTFKYYINENAEKIWNKLTDNNS